MLTNRKMFSSSSIVVLVIVVVVAMMFVVSGCMARAEFGTAAGKSGCKALTDLNANKGYGYYEGQMYFPPQPKAKKPERGNGERITRRGARDL